MGARRASRRSRRAWRPWPARRGRGGGVRHLENVGAQFPSSVAMSPSTPGRSGIVRRNATMRSSRSSSRTMIEASMRGSILPPHRIRPTLRPRKRSGCASKRGEAGGAGALRHGLLQREIGVDRALEMGLVDQDDLAHISRTIGSVSRPTFLTAMPSASVGPPIGRLSPCRALTWRGRAPPRRRRSRCSA